MDGGLLGTALVVVGAYLLGSFPTAYLAGRLLKGIDIRQYGSGSVGGSNVWESVSRWAMVPVAAIDIAKGGAAVLVAQALDMPLIVQSSAGAAAVGGHNWSAFLRLTGGRGVAPAVGSFLALAPWAGALGCAVGLAGIPVRQMPLTVALGLLIVPIAALARGEPNATVAGTAVIAGLVFAKRLLGNPGTEASGVSWGERMVNRLLFDRDIRDRRAWLSRHPHSESRDSDRER